MKIPFDISHRPQIESGEYKVVTADDHPVRICCWDAEEDWPIVALVKDYSPESDHCYPMMCDTAGVSATKGRQKQLYVITPALSDFEKQVLHCIEGYDPEIMDDEEMRASAKEEAKKLLDLARKELQPKYDATKVDEALIDKMAGEYKGSLGITAEVTAYIEGLRDMYKQFAEELDIAFKHQDEVIFSEGYDKGQKDALKDLPHWTPTTALSGIYSSTGRLVCDGYQISIPALLEKLPKDEQDNN